MSFLDKILGFTLPTKKTESPSLKKQSFIFPNKNDGAAVIEGLGALGGRSVFMMDVEGLVRSEQALIGKYRDMLTHPEINRSVNQIINDFITVEPGKPAASVVLDNVDSLSESIKKRIIEEFHTICKLLDFNDKAYSIVKRFYVDGRLYYYIKADPSKPKDGIQELIYIDPRQIRKVREVKTTKDITTGADIIEIDKEYYVYSSAGVADNDAPSNGNGSGGFGGSSSFFDNGSSTTVMSGGMGSFNPMQSQIALSVDSVAYIHSDNPDKNSQMILSYLHPAIRPLNLLRMIEDAIVIYRTARAPERRVFYIDVGNMPVRKQEEYIKSIMDTFRNKTTYDAVTGEIRDDKRYLSMMEDFWLPRSEGARGTEVDTLPGGQNLGNIEDIEYFQRKLYESLEVPISRMNRDKSFSLGRTSEITQDELAFSKFITRLRTEFSELFFELLKRQLILKKILTIEEWYEHKDNIYFSFNQDSFFAEFKKADLMRERIALLRDAEPYVGTYFSKQEIFSDVLVKTEEEVRATLDQIKQELADDMTTEKDSQMSEIDVAKTDVEDTNTLDTDIEELDDE